jgi:hypothetical protein
MLVMYESENVPNFTISHTDICKSGVFQLWELHHIHALISLLASRNVTGPSNKAFMLMEKANYFSILFCY